MADTTIPRIYSPPIVSAGSLPPAPGPAPQPPAKNAGPTQQNDPPWFAKLMLMFPAEAVTAYTAGVQYFSGGKIWIVLVTLAALLVARWFALKPADGGPVNYVVLAIAGVSFLLWVGSTADIELTKDIMKFGILIAETPELANKELQRFSAFFILIWTWIMPGISNLNPSQRPK